MFRVGCSNTQTRSLELRNNFFGDLRRHAPSRCGSAHSGRREQCRSWWCDTATRLNVNRDQCRPGNVLRSLVCCCTPGLEGWLGGARGGIVRYMLGLIVALLLIVSLAPAADNAGKPVFPYGAVYFRKSNPPEADWARDHQTAARIGMNTFRHWFMWAADRNRARQVRLARLRPHDGSRRAERHQSRDRRTHHGCAGVGIPTNTPTPAIVQAMGACW